MTDNNYIVQCYQKVAGGKHTFLLKEAIEFSRTEHKLMVILGFSKERPFSAMLELKKDISKICSEP